MNDVLTKAVTVPASPQEAFRRFTSEIHSWWPLGAFSVYGEAAEWVGFEGWVGGKLVERGPDGGEATWGTVLAWDPPRRLVFTWHPGRAPETAQQVEVSFRPIGEETQVELIHTGWDALGEAAAETRKRYEGGWERVLGSFAAVARP